MSVRLKENKYNLNIEPAKAGFFNTCIRNAVFATSTLQMWMIRKGNCKYNIVDDIVRFCKADVIHRAIVLPSQIISNFTNPGKPA